MTKSYSKGSEPRSGLDLSLSRVLRNGEGKERQLATEDFGTREKGKLRLRITKYI